jgi:hypothetical protein
MRSNEQASNTGQNIMKTQIAETKTKKDQRSKFYVLCYFFHLKLNTFNLKLFLVITSYFILLTSYFSVLDAQIKDRVVAFVDNDAITLSELEEKYSSALQITPDITREEVLRTMVNRLLLLREARKIKLEALTEDELLQEYIDFKIRAFIRVNEEDIVNFYEGHIEDFQEKELETVREDIENVLIEKALNERLISHINELKEKSCVKIQLYEGE